MGVPSRSPPTAVRRVLVLRAAMPQRRTSSARTPCCLLDAPPSPSALEGADAAAVTMRVICVASSTHSLGCPQPHRCHNAAVPSWWPRVDRTWPGMNAAAFPDQENLEWIARRVRASSYAPPDPEGMGGGSERRAVLRRCPFVPCQCALLCARFRGPVSCLHSGRICTARPISWQPGSHAPRTRLSSP